jgi:hypothetical protein
MAATAQIVRSGAPRTTPGDRPPAARNGGFARAMGRRLSPRCVASCRTPARTSAGPVLRPGGGEARSQPVVEHEEPAEMEPPLSKIITSQGRTRRGMCVRRCWDRSMPGLARRRRRPRGILANGGRQRAGTGHLSSAQGGRVKPMRLFRYASSESTTLAGARRCAEHLHQLAQAPTAGSRASRPRTASCRGRQHRRV